LETKGEQNMTECTNKFNQQWSNFRKLKSGMLQDPTTSYVVNLMQRKGEDVDYYEYIKSASDDTGYSMEEIGAIMSELSKARARDKVGNRKVNEAFNSYVASLGTQNEADMHKAFVTICYEYYWRYGVMP